jgi:hypothetical protein
MFLLILACGQAEQQADRGSMGESHDQQTETAKGHESLQLHGGLAVVTKAHHFEVVFLADGIRVYTYDGDQKPTSAEGTTGQVTIQYTDQTKEATSLDLEYVPSPEIEMDKETLIAHDYLFVPMDLSTAEAGSFQAQFAFSEMPGDVEPTAQFVSVFESVVDRPYFCPMHADVWGETSESLCSICGGMKTSAERPAR